MKEKVGDLNENFIKFCSRNFIGKFYEIGLDKNGLHLIPR